MMQSNALPARADVVVVGGGIVGVSAALHLAKKGVSVTLCEKGRIAGEQSSRNWGWCRTMGRDLAELPLAIESLRLWARHERDKSAARPASATAASSTSAKPGANSTPMKRGSNRPGSFKFSRACSARPR